MQFVGDEIFGLIFDQSLLVVCRCASFTLLQRLFDEPVGDVVVVLCVRDAMMTQMQVKVKSVQHSIKIN